MDAHGCAVAILIDIRTVPETGSTNADMLALARTGSVADGFWLRAERQSAGRGRQGRDWASPVGNFYGSTVVLLRPGDPPAATLGFVAAVALAEVVADLLPAQGERLVLKWPNDLLVGGAKLSGILLERADDAVVVGVGVNLIHHPVLADRLTTDLSVFGVRANAVIFAQALAEAFARWLERWRLQGFAPVRAQWLAAAHPVGTVLVAALPDGSRVSGMFEDLDPDGVLILRLASGERRGIHAGDVFLV